MGVRTLVEILARHILGAEEPSLGAYIKTLQDNGWISAKQVEILDASIQLGHSAIHRGYIPKQKQVIHGLEIIENLMELYLVHKRRAESIKGTLPKDTRRKKKIKRKKYKKKKKTQEKRK